MVELIFFILSSVFVFIKIPHEIISTQIRMILLHYYIVLVW